MKMRFLCASHRAELSHKSSQAINCWQNGFDTGQLYYEQNMWRDALPHLGCAFESAEIIISTHAIDRLHAYELFSCSALLLSDTFVQLNFADHAHAICCLSISRLERELNYSAKTQLAIKRHLNRLYERISQLNTLLANQPFCEANRTPLQQYTFAANR